MLKRKTPDPKYTISPDKEKASVAIYDLFGSLKRLYNLTKSSGHYTINTEAFSAGI